MKSTYRLVLGVAVLFVIGAIGWSVSSQSSASAAQKSKASAAEAAGGAQNDVERGRYLVEEVAMCGECHTPRLPDGDTDRSRWLQGAAIWIVPVQANPNWAMRAPSLAGMPYSDQQAEDVLERGMGPNGQTIQPPMHIYHMHHADAVAIIAYLRSLPPSTNRE
jgi:mono/diheme cytochrome c family protein